MKVNELPNELSTCVCAAAWMMVSIFSVSSTYLSSMMRSQLQQKRGYGTGARDKVGRQNVALDELEIWAVLDSVKVTQATAVVHFVQAHNLRGVEQS